MSRTFCAGGLLDRGKHYHVDQNDEIDSIVENLRSEKYTLLHAYRQAGKTSVLIPIAEKLLKKEYFVITITLQGIGRNIDLWGFLHQRIAEEYDGIDVFADGGEFKEAFVWSKFNRDVYLIIDEIDKLLIVPEHEKFLSILKYIIDVRGTHSARPYALAGILGVGSFHVNKLMRFRYTPFYSIHKLHPLQHSLCKVLEMFTQFGSDIGIDMTVFAHDIYSRTRGHLGFISMLGKILEEWVTRNKKLGGGITIMGWVAYLYRSRFAGDLALHPCIQSILCSLSKKDKTAQMARKIVNNMLHGKEFISDLSFVSQDFCDAVDHLEAEGVLVREYEGGSAVMRFTAPLLRIVLYSYFHLFDMMDIPMGIYLPMTNMSGVDRYDRCDELDLVGCIREAIPYLDRGAIFHDKYLGREGTSLVYACHFELFHVLSAMACPIGCVITCDARTDADDNKILDIFATHRGDRYCFEIIADTTKSQFTQQYNQTRELRKEVSLRKLLVVNLITILNEDSSDRSDQSHCSDCSDCSDSQRWFIADDQGSQGDQGGIDPDISIIHVHIPSEGSYAAIMSGVDPESDDRIELPSVTRTYIRALDLRP